jgi:hypothetical protein
MRASYLKLHIRGLISNQSALFSVPGTAPPQYDTQCSALAIPLAHPCHPGQHGSHQSPEGTQKKGRP